ncbi:hypothetical protein F4604DRAFT_1682426 [Suillus subluteus]|nr:hypothetical protein F4604DRAFT_1682426 [Suillus subluteus]
MWSLSDADTPGTFLSINPDCWSSNRMGMSDIYGLNTADRVIVVVFMVPIMLLMLTRKVAASCTPGIHGSEVYYEKMDKQAVSLKSLVNQKGRLGMWLLVNGEYAGVKVQEREEQTTKGFGFCDSREIY